MPTPLATLKAKVHSRVNADTNKLTDTVVEAAIAAAVAQYSSSRPREVVAKVAGDDVFDYPLDGLSAILAKWSVGFSSILEIAYPYDVTEPDQEALETERYGVLQLDTGWTLRFFEDVPTSSEDFLVRYTGIHEVLAASTTVPAIDEEALADLVAAYCCEALATLYIKSLDSSIQADGANYLSKSNEYRSQAKRWRELYAAKLKGQDSAEVKAAGGFVQVESRFSNTLGDRWFFHGERR